MILRTSHWLDIWIELMASVVIYIPKGLNSLATGRIYNIFNSTVGWGEGPRALVTPVKAIRVRVVFFIKKTFSIPA